MKIAKRLLLRGRGNSSLPPFTAGDWSVRWDGAIITGGDVTDVNIDGVDYRVHTFNTSGELVVTQEITVEFMLGAGAGGGGYVDSSAGGGGGAGGLKPPTQITLQPDTYPIVVGAGGPGAKTGTSTNGSSGSNSMALGFSMIGGGFGSGASAFQNPAGDGGSGGGAGAGSIGRDAGNGTVGQGNSGGIGYGNSNVNVRRAGGGGGYLTAGTNGYLGVRGVGGEGLISDFDGILREYAKGGNGDDAGNTAPSPAQQNTSSGGDGGSYDNFGEDGADGFFKLRYPI